MQRAVAHPKSERPRTGRGLSTASNERDSVPCHYRAAAAEVEAVDQLAADRLHVLFRILKADQSQRCDEREGGAGSGEGRVFDAVAGVTILRFPVQARDQVEAVFIAGADEPALVLLRVQRNAGRRVVQEVRKGDALEARFGVAAGDVSQQSGNHHVANTAANSPGILLPFLAVHAETAGANDARRLQVTPQAAPVVVAERADHPAIRKLIVAADLHGAEPTLTAGICLTRDHKGRRIDRVVTLVEHAVAATGTDVT